MNNKSKKVPMIIGAVFLLIVAIAVAVFMNTGKPGETNQDVNLKGTTTANLENKLEYGENINDKKFTVNTKQGEKAVNLTDLDPVVDTMIVGKTEHEVKVEGETFDVIVVIQDTKKPVLTGVEELIEIESETPESVNVEEELKALVTAEDPVDGQLEVIFTIENDAKRVNKYNVSATSTDKNGNNTNAKFVVEVKKSKNAAADKDKEADIVTNTDGTNADPNNSANTNGSEGKNPSNSNGAVNPGNVVVTPKPVAPKQPVTTTPQQPAQTKPTPAPQTKPEVKPTPKPQPKPEVKPTPKPQPKPEVKPTPAPQPKPQPKPSPSEGVQKPAKLPAGASVISDNGLAQEYSYNKNLPDGGKINKISVDRGSVTAVGVDKNGTTILFSYNYKANNSTFDMTQPSVSSDSMSVLYEIVYAFADAYGF